jgi:hypothetical protein
MKQGIGNVIANLTTAKNKVVALWKSGLTGQIIIIVAAILIFKLMDVSLRHKSTQSDSVAQSDKSDRAKSARAFFIKALEQEGKYWTESNTETPEEYDHLPYMKVEPNILTLPEYFSQGSLTFVYCQVGTLYAYDGGYKVDFVGDGYVIAQGYPPDKLAYIKTKHEYTDGEYLRPGLYECIGRKKVPLTNGSHVTMFAFEQLSDELFNDYQRIVTHNKKVEGETFKENDRRKGLAHEKKIEVLRNEIAAALRDEFKNFDVAKAQRELESRIHIASTFNDKVKLICKFEFAYPFVKSDTGDVLDRRNMTYEEVRKAVEDGTAVSLIERGWDLTNLIRNSKVKDWVHSFFLDYKPDAMDRGNEMYFTGMKRSFTIDVIKKFDSEERCYLRFVNPDRFPSRWYYDKDSDSGNLLTGEHVFLLPYEDVSILLLQGIKSPDAFMRAFEERFSNGDLSK